MERLKKLGRYSARVLNRSKPKEENAEFNQFNFVTDFKEEKFSVAWRLENIHRCTLKCQEFIESPAFSTRFGGEVKWALRVYPRGRKMSENARLNKTCYELAFMGKECEHVGLFLHRISSDPATSSFKYRLSCEGYLSDKYPKLVTSLNYPNTGAATIEFDSTVFSEYGTDKLFCSECLSSSKAFLVRCDIYVTNVFNSGTPVNYTSDSFKSCTLFQDLKCMYENGRFSDVTLQVRDQKFPAHKAVLASRSKVFDAMFQHDMKENQTNVIQIDDIEPAILSSLLQYIYTGSVDDFNVERAIVLYSAADKYMLDELKEWCVNIMLAKLTVENVCQIVVLTELHPNPKLKDAALNMFRNYTGEIFKRKEWQILVGDSDCHKLVSEILRAVSIDFITNCIDN